MKRTTTKGQTMTTKITKSEAPTLDDLRSLLVEMAATGNQVKLSDVVDLTSLPIYGDLNPEDTTGIYSWDDSRVLLDDGNGRWSIVDAK